MGGELSLLLNRPPPLPQEFRELRVRSLHRRGEKEAYRRRLAQSSEAEKEREEVEGERVTVTCLVNMAIPPPSQRVRNWYIEHKKLLLCVQRTTSVPASPFVVKRREGESTDEEFLGGLWQFIMFASAICHSFCQGLSAKTTTTPATSRWRSF